MRQYFRRSLISLFAVFLCLSTVCHVFAASSPYEVQTAAAYLREQGVMVGDQNGDMNLDSGLTRAEMAVLLTRLHGGAETDPTHYTWACYFTDVPEWAKPYVGYCTANLLVAGYGNSLYGSYDAVTPQMACTVVLRAFSYTDGWSYEGACPYAVQQGLIDQSVTQEKEISRGDMAVLIYRAMQKQGESKTPQTPKPQADGITIASDGTITSKTITQPDWSREDFSQQANPDIFTGYYTRGWYNAIRQSIVDRDTILAGNNESDLNPQYLYAHTLIPNQPTAAFDAFSYVLGRIHGLYYYYCGAEPYTQNQYEFPGYTIIKVLPGWLREETLSFIQPKLDEVQGLDDRSKVIVLNNYLCDLMEYDTEATAVEDVVFSPHTAPVRGQCSSYATAFSFLCSAADIPCILVSSTTHSWNEVYVDGQWLTVDVSSNDSAGGPNRDNYLMKDRVPGVDRCPEGTCFAKELLVPGSTT